MSYIARHFKPKLMETIALGVQITIRMKDLREEIGKKVVKKDGIISHRETMRGMREIEE